MLCQSQKPDTVHNITPPHMGAAVLRRVETKQKIPIKSRNLRTVGPAPTKGYFNPVVNNPTHNLHKFLREFGAPNAITPRRYPVHKRWSVIVELSWGLINPRATINCFLGLLCSAVDADPLCRRGASNPPGSEEHCGDAIQAPSSPQ